jgi:hypothetical protein
VTARNFHGFSLNSGYTWGKALDIASGNAGGGNYYAPGIDYGRANSDVRHRVTFSPTYRIPGPMGYGGLLEGWRVNANIKYQTGRGYDAGDGDLRGDGGTTRWDFTGDPGDFVYDRHGVDVAVFHAPDGQLGEENPQTGLPYGPGDLATATSACISASRSLATLATFGCWTQGGSALTPGSLGSYGTMPKSLLSGPSFFGFDMSVTKTQRITERVNAEFRAEFFNVLNHPAFADPETGLGCEVGECNFGQSTATPDTASTNPVLGSGGPRRIQMGVKLTF